MSQDLIWKITGSNPSPSNLFQLTNSLLHHLALDIAYIHVRHLSNSIWLECACGRYTWTKLSLKITFAYNSGPTSIMLDVHPIWSHRHHDFICASWKMFPKINNSNNNNFLFNENQNFRLTSSGGGSLSMNEISCRYNCCFVSSIH